VTSPFTSYADQIYSIHKSRSSAGFSLDIPLIILVSCIAKIFYWLGARFDTALLIQAFGMILVQLFLLQIALNNRPLGDVAEGRNTPFAPARANRRPYEFWQWRSKRPYWLFLAYFSIVLCILQAIFGTFTAYTSVLGYFALAVEATLPIPQIVANEKNRSVKGFRLSVLGNWLLGDVMKQLFFFLSETSIPWSFKLCGFFQFACDIYLGIQYAKFGSSPG
jgi:hypothetical protein